MNRTFRPLDSDHLVQVNAGFLHTTAGTAVVHLSHRNSVRPSVSWMDQSKTVQARITKSSPSAAWNTLVSGSVKFFHKLERGHSDQGR